MNYYPTLITFISGITTVSSNYYSVQLHMKAALTPVQKHQCEHLLILKFCSIDSIFPEEHLLTSKPPFWTYSS